MNLRGTARKSPHLSSEKPHLVALRRGLCASCHPLRFKYCISTTDQWQIYNVARTQRLKREGLVARLNSCSQSARRRGGIHISPGTSCVRWAEVRHRAGQHRRRYQEAKVKKDMPRSTPPRATPSCSQDRLRYLGRVSKTAFVQLMNQSSIRQIGL